MKIKLIQRKEYLENVNPEGKLVFSVESPFSRIARPHNSFVMACHGKPFIQGFFDGVQTGTAYAIGLSIVEKPIRVYAWRIIPREGSLSFELQEHNKKTLGYHYDWGLQPFMENQAPEWVKHEVEGHLENFVL